MSCGEDDNEDDDLDDLAQLALDSSDNDSVLNGMAMITDDEMSLDEEK
jgi:hypothetical protein